MLVTWVKKIRRLGGRTRGSDPISFTIRASRMGSVTAPNALLAHHLVHHPREAEWGLGDLCSTTNRPGE